MTISDYFPFDGAPPRSQREAEAAMMFAASTEGAEREKWIGVAMAWQELARLRKRSGSDSGAEEAA